MNVRIYECQTAPTHSAYYTNLLNRLHLVDATEPGFNILSHTEHSVLGYNTLELEYELPKTTVVRIKHDNFTVPTKLSSKFKLSAFSRKLSENLAITSQVVYDTPTGVLPQRRIINYSADTGLSPSDFVVSAPQSSLKRQTFTLSKLPPAEGNVKVLSLVDLLTSYTQASTFTSEAELRVAAKGRGLVAQSYIKSALNWPTTAQQTPVFTLESFAYGLFYAIDQDDTQLIISQLNEFVSIAQALGWVDQDINGRFTANLDLINGLPSSFNLGGVAAESGTNNNSVYLPPNQPQEIALNALLGLALTTAIRHLQDVWPLNSVMLYGSREDYQELLKASLKALAYFCGYGISPITNWVAFSFEDGVYDYNQPSRAASYLTDLFLADYLLLDNDPQLYVWALALHDQILRSEQNPNLTSFTEFKEADYVNLKTILDPLVVASNPTAASLLSDCGVCAYRYLWCLLFKKTDLTAAASILYVQARAAYRALYPAGAAAICLLRYDFVYTWLYTTLQPNSVLDTWQTQLLNTALTNPIITGSDATTYGIYIPGPRANYRFLSFESKVLTEMSQGRRNIFKGLDESYNEALYTAVNAASLQELRRMWPFGYHWTGSDEEDDPTSAIGSILFAESRVHTYNLIAEQLVKLGTTPSTASGQALTDWADLLATSLNLSSSVFIQGWLVSLLQTNSSLEHLVVETFGYGSAEIQTLEVPTYYIRETLGSPERHTSYVSTNAGLERAGLDKELYYSIGYKPSEGFFVSDVDYLTSSRMPLNKNFGFIKRRVAGLPQLYPRVSYHDILVSSTESVANCIRIDEDQVVTPENYIPGTKNVWVRDKAVVIDPLGNYAANESVVLGDRVVPFLPEAIKRTQTAGIMRTIASNYTSLCL